MKLSEIKKNPSNPRQIDNDKFKKLVKSIEQFPEMMELRPIVINEDNIILGGNMRFEALRELGYKKVPDGWIVKASELSEEQEREFIIKDNTGFGEWDYDMLANEWDEELLKDWALELPDIEGEDNFNDEEAEVEFSEYLNEENNFVVLVFKTEVDWLQAMTHFDLKSVYSKRSNGEPWSKGIGRVVDGAEYLDELEAYNRSKDE